MDAVEITLVSIVVVCLVAMLGIVSIPYLAYKKDHE